ncbi:MAG: hypothetical protein ACFFFK_00125 [Candidatus Thorarchaeota archaeon]
MSRYRRRSYIAVKRGEVVQCRWCGTTESRHWVHTEGGPWCSTRCRSAEQYDESICVTIAFPTLFFGGYLIYSGFNIPLQPIALLLIIPILICCPASCGIPGIISGNSARREVPYMSRRFERAIDQEVHLQKCAHCGGPLESEKGVQSIQCSYCGTINKADAIVKGSHDDWI